MLTAAENSRLSFLREAVASRVSGKRLTHTLSVERECASLASIFAPALEFELCAAGLLHDVTKQLNLEKQLQLCDKFGIIYTSGDLLAPKTFHARTAEAVIRDEFPEFATDSLLSAVRYHTTGRAHMTLSESLVYLADYIEETRTFPDCVELRARFYSGLDSLNGDAERLAHLRDILLLSFDMTIRGLIDDSAPIHPDTLEARNSLLEEKLK